MINRFKRPILILFSCLAVFALFSRKLPFMTERLNFEISSGASSGVFQQKQLLTVKRVKEVELTEEGHLVTFPRSNTRNIHKQDESGPGIGYIAALNYYEQQTMAAGNLLQLQCFASMLNLSVVQPLMKNSRFIVPLKKDEASNMLKMSSVFDMKKWNQHTSSKGYAPLIPWEEFIEHAPRNVILVQMKHPTLTYIKQAKKNGLEFPHPVSEHKDYERGCGYKLVNKAFAELQAYNFTVVGRVCYNYLTGDLIPLDAYLKDLSSKGRKITILMDEWRGVGSSQRVLIDKEVCVQSGIYREHTEYSPALHEDAAAYIKKYITNNKSEDYLAVMARFEMTGLTQRLRDSTDPHAIIPYCLTKTLKEIKSMKKTYDLDKTFVSMDIGKYGSKSFKVKKYFGHLKDMALFLKDGYRGKMDITRWEESFEDVAKSTDAGYIAILQQLLVSKAKCVLFVGGGTFQRHTLHMFQQTHRTPTAMCIETIDKCTSSYRSFMD